MSSNLPLAAVVEAWLTDLNEKSGRAIVAELTALSKAIRGDESVRRVLLAPTIAFGDKEAVLKKAGVSNETRALLRYVDEHALWSKLQSLAHEAQKSVAAKHNLARATVVTAVELTDKERTKLTAQLEQRTKATIELEEIVDPNLIGGLVVDVAGDRLDLSLRGKLTRLKQAVSSLT